MHAVCDPADHDASVWQHQEQCQNSHSLVRNRLVKTLPTVKTQGDVGFQGRNSPRSEKRDISATRTSSGTIFGAWETSGAGFDDGVEYFVVLQHHNKDPCMNPATQ